MIGSRMNRCTRTLITAFTSQINGGNAMTPGLSSDLSMFNVKGFCALILQPVLIRHDKKFAAPAESRLQQGSIGTWKFE